MCRESPEWKSHKFCENMFFVFSEDGSFREKKSFDQPSYIGSTPNQEQ